MNTEQTSIPFGRVECPRCKGSGKFERGGYTGLCFACKGDGNVPAPRDSEPVQLGAGAATIRDALNNAAGSGLKSPRLLTGEIDFARAKDNSRNPGCVYVTRNEIYLGKIDPQGRFIPSRECTDDDHQTIAEVARNPLEAAVKHGRMTGRCACCNRPLRDPDSVKLGIGPICRTKFFGV